MTTKVETLLQEIQQLSPADREHLLEAILKFLQTETEASNLAQLNAQYPNEWLAVIIPKGEDRYDPQRGYLVAHSPDKSVVWQQVVKLPASDDIFVFFNGSVITKGFGIIFYDPTNTPVVATVVD